MQNENIFTDIKLLIVIIVVFVTLSTGLYYIFNDAFDKQSSTSDSSHLQQEVTDSVKTQNISSTQNEIEVSKPVDADVVTSMQSVILSRSGKYTLPVPSSWRTEEIFMSIAGGSDTVKSILIYDEDNRLVMVVNQPLREIGYEISTSELLPKIGTGIGALKVVLRTDSENANNGFVHYMWEGEDDFWDNSFEILVHFGNSKYYKNLADKQTDGGVSFKYKTVEEIISKDVFSSQIEDLIGGISFTNNQ